jgi:hypothetical protein
MLPILTEKKLKTAKKYVCEKCRFECSKKSNYDTHILTLKHTQAYAGLQENAEKCHNKIKVCGVNTA